MLDTTTMLLSGICLLVILSFLFACWLRPTSNEPSIPAPGSLTPSARLFALAAERPDYLIFVGVPLSHPTKWAAVAHIAEESVTVDGHGIFALSEVRSFVVAYPNGQLVECTDDNLPLPKGVSGLMPSRDIHTDLLQLEDLIAGKQYLEITYGPSTSKPHERSHYSTTLTNISTTKIKVGRFAGYWRSPRGWTLSTVTNKFYSADEFREWYGLGHSTWILPGQSVTDTNNYGSRPVLWAYYCESEPGEHFIAGAVLE